MTIDIPPELARRAAEALKDAQGAIADLEERPDDYGTAEVHAEINAVVRELENLIKPVPQTLYWLSDDGRTE